MNLQITQQNALQAYNVADAAGKKMLESLFGKQALLGNVKDIVESFDDILAIAGKTMDDIAKPGDEPDEIAYKQAKLIAKVYNNGRKLDPMNTNQPKYFPWHRIDGKSGSGLAYDGCDHWASYSFVGVRLCFFDSDDSMDAGKKFLDIYAALKIQ